MVPGTKQQALDKYFADNISDEYKKPLSILTTGLNKLDKYGESLRLYFSFLDQFIFLSLALSFFCYVNARINEQGGFYNGTNKNLYSSLDRVSPELLANMNLYTLSNFFGYANFTLDP